MTDKKRILVVDDEEEMATTMKEILELEGFEVEIGHDGQEGLDKARSQRPDLIVSDVNMPVLDGFSMVRMLKFDKNYQKIPIVMLTTRGKLQDKNIGLDVGADGYFEKPFDIADLVIHVKMLLGIEGVIKPDREDR